MIRFSKLLISILCLAVLFSGCSAAEESAAEQTYASVRSMAEAVSSAVTQKDWKTLSGLFARSSEQSHRAKDLKALWAEQTSEDPGECLAEGVVFEDDRKGGELLFLAGDQEVQADFRLAESGKISSLQFFLRSEDPVLESSDTWTETAVSFGKEVSMRGVLTLPKDVESPPVAILMPEGMKESCNRSGNDDSFRKDFAHALAEAGIASVRWNTRLEEDPYLIQDSSEYSLNRILLEDFASVVHSLERYPVNAADIIYIGLGTGGSLGYYLVNSHFEITGGLVLLNAPYEEDGISLLSRAEELNISADEVKYSIAAEPEIDPMIGGYPLTYWKDWNTAGALNYTPKVSMPIAILQGEADTITKFSSDYESWKSQKGSNVSMKSYPGLGHYLRETDGSLSADVVNDIVRWHQGEDIEKEGEEDDS
ncbi:MAG: alpha/beta hydrolase [Stecheria intestinalis]|nr:alpha/beta hydrolase [Stecheria intestinalis]MDY4681627.1 alpha/beta hydrolase [Lachnospiraceae bacterium]